MASKSHTLMDGKVHVYRRENSRFWQCSVFLSGRNHRSSTKQDNLVLAIEYARDWYMDRYADDRLRRRGVSIPAAAEATHISAHPEGNPRTAYSLRHTYISMRLMEGADIYQIAKNCRTSVEMIQKFYASHIANTLNAAAINVRRPPKPRKAPSAQKALVNAKAPPRANARTPARLAPQH